MEFRIETLPETKLIGKHQSMSFANNTTEALWKSFMPRRKEIRNTVNAELISLQVFDSTFSFQKFDPHIPFVKWAGVAVIDFNSVPEGLETFTIPEGLYAVFLHRGASQTAPQTFGYIFGTWLPASAYELDNRPHFEILGAKYQHNSPDSEEEIWIPVKPKMNEATKPEM